MTTQMKPKTNRKGTKHKVSKMDQCQTPKYALAPLLPYIKEEWRIWEPATGEGFLLEEILKHNAVIGTELESLAHNRTLYMTKNGSIIFADKDFFEYDPKEWDCQITNPPYSVKYDWLERSYELGKPFALLLPVETLGAQRAQKLFSKHGMQVILMNRRVDFIMPNKGLKGNGAQFPVCWITWQFNLPSDIVYANLDKPSKAELAEQYEAYL